MYVFMKYTCMYLWHIYHIYTHTHTHTHMITGELVTRQPLIASMRVVKKETLKLISSWVSRSSDPGMVCVHSFSLHTRIGGFPSLYKVLIGEPSVVY